MSDRDDQLTKELQEKADEEDPPPAPVTTKELQEKARRAAEGS